MLYPMCVYSPIGVMLRECLWKWCDPDTWAPTGNPEIPKAGGSIGLVAIFSFSSSASWSLLAFARLFWNQILTCVSVRFSELENSARSAMDRYCFWRNFLSSASSCDVLNGVRGFRLLLCFLKGHAGGLRRPDKTNNNNVKNFYDLNVLVYAFEVMYENEPYHSFTTFFVCKAIITTNWPWCHYSITIDLS